MQEVNINIQFQSLTLTELNTQEQALVIACKNASANAYAPYSQFQVGASLLISDDEILLAMLLAKNFGSVNSFTEDEKTTFYFDSDYKGFEECMEVFSRLFANPKLDINIIPAHLLKIEDELTKKEA